MHVTLEYPEGIIHAGAASYLMGEGHFTVEAEKGTFACQGASFSQSARAKPSPKKLFLPDGTYFQAPDTLQLAVFHDHFAEAIRTKTPFICLGEMRLRDITISEAIYHSVAQGSSRVLV